MSITHIIFAFSMIMIGIFIIGLPLLWLVIDLFLGNDLFDVLIALMYFSIISIPCIASGVYLLHKSLIKPMRTIETCGFIVDCAESKNQSKDSLCTVYDFKILVLKNDDIFEEYTKSIKYSNNIYTTGSYIKLNYYKKDLNILGHIEESMIPDNLRDYVKSNYPDIHENLYHYEVYKVGEE